MKKLFGLDEPLVNVKGEAYQDVKTRRDLMAYLFFDSKVENKNALRISSVIIPKLIQTKENEFEDGDIEIMKTTLDSNCNTQSAGIMGQLLSVFENIKEQGEKK